MTQDGFDPRKLFAQARELQERMQRMQEDLRRRTVEATVGGGMVTCEVNGQLEVVRIDIDPAALDARDVHMLQDLIRSAVNEAMKRVRELVQTEMQKVAGDVPGVQMPGGQVPEGSES